MDKKLISCILFCSCGGIIPQPLQMCRFIFGPEIKDLQRFGGAVFCRARKENVLIGFTQLPDQLRVCCTGSNLSKMLSS